LPTLGLALGLCLLSGGCKKPQQRPRAADIHAITRELATAASSAARPGSPVQSEVRSELRASDEHPESTDLVDIGLSADSADASGLATVAPLLQALGRVATRHGLTQDAQSESREGIRFNYSHAGLATHTVHIHLLGASASRESSPGIRAGQARLAIILDDLGNDRSAAEAVFALGYPLTISVLPNRPHSVDIAEAAHRRGFQVMLHLPMESFGNGKAESQELRPGMSEGEVSRLVNEFLHAVPDVAGVNNHQGSQSTADAALMAALMPVLRERNLFYIDSRTTAATVAYDTARKAGVRAAFRNVPFLDDVAEVSSVSKQLQRAMRDAREKGDAVAIGHPHSATLKALREVLPQAKSQGVRLVYASDLVR
jgi:polysaccharide deacetylase 2 family uncharacterized protein YibQ